MKHTEQMNTLPLSAQSASFAVKNFRGLNRRTRARSGSMLNTTSKSSHYDLLFVAAGVLACRLDIPRKAGRHGGLPLQNQF
jgi:hypothetical protein